MLQIILDVETKKTFTEVGGYFPDRLGISFAGVNIRNGFGEAGEFRSYFEKDIPELLVLLERADVVVGLTENKLDLHQLDIAREIQEEIGLAIPPANFTHDKLVLFKTFFEPARNRYDFICGWAVLAENELDPSSVVISDEHSEYRWVTEAEALELDFDEPTGTFVKEIIISAFRLKK
jgi:hypothetical protein